MLSRNSRADKNAPFTNALTAYGKKTPPET